MLTMHINWRREVLHQRELSVAHIAAVGLNQEWVCIPARCQSYAVVKNATIPRVRRIPFGIAVALRMAEFLIVCWQKAIHVNGRAKDHAIRDLKDRFLNVWQDLIQKPQVLCRELLRISALDRRVISVKKIRGDYLVVFDCGFKNFTDLFCSGLSRLDKGRI